VRQVLELFIRLDGCDVRSAAEVEMASLLLEGWQPDLVVLDVDTAALAQMYLETELAAPAALLLSTSPLGPDVLAKFGAASYLTKPIALGTLARLIEELAPCRR
jgi:DNA-binding response OmpR family regulator